MDRICTDILSFEGDGNVGHYADRTQSYEKIEGDTKSLEKKKEKQPITDKTKPKDKEVSALSLLKNVLNWKNCLQKLMIWKQKSQILNQKCVNPNFTNLILKMRVRRNDFLKRELDG